MKRTAVVSLLGSLLLGALMSSARAQCGGQAKLDDLERAAFIAAAYGHRGEISVELLASEGCSETMVEGLHALGAKVRFVDEKVGYAWIVLPKDKVLNVLDLPGIAEAWAGGLDYSYSIVRDPGYVAPAERKATSVTPFTIPLPRVAKVLPKDGPYFPAAEAGLTELWKDHPQADGRGVRVALYDDGLDLLHPALAKAVDTNGREVPKVADIVTTSSSEEDAGWVVFGEPLRTEKGMFEAAGQKWRAPYDGSFRFGIFSTQVYFGMWFPGVSRGEPPARLSLSVGVLWDESANRVWVDTDGDGSFLNQKALGDYGETHDVDFFGHKNGQDDNRVPFAVKIDCNRRAAYISLRQGGHSTFVAGTLSANRLTGGLYDGSAPNSQLVDVRPPQLNGMVVPIIAALARKDVDVVNRSGGIIGLAPGSFNEEDFYRHVLDRATSVYNKPLACFCQSMNALWVSDYQSAEMLRRNRQTQPPFAEAINATTRPASDGLVNTLLAPSASLGTQSRYMPIYVVDKGGRTTMVGGEKLEPPGPDGYSIGSNPSPAIPFGAGVLADLISEARRLRVRYDATRLVTAVLTGTRVVPGFPTAQQGYGLINAEGAWSQLQKMSRVDDPDNPQLTSFVIEQEGKGGREEIGGFWADFPRTPETEQLWVTRRGGYAGAREYRLSLRGDDGAFTLLDQTVSLVSDTAVPLRFSFKPLPGQHLAFLRLTDVKTGVLMREIPLTVRANVGEVVGPGVEVYEATLLPLHHDFAAFHLDDEVQAARFAMRIPNAGPARISLRMIPGFMYGAEGDARVGGGGRLVETSRPPGEPVDPKHHVGPMQQFESLIVNDRFRSRILFPDKPGVYQFGWSNGGGIEYATPYDDPVPDVPIKGSVVITKYAVSFRKDVDKVLATNQLAEINGKVELYDAKLTVSELPSDGPHAQAVWQRTLPTHLSQWRIRVSAASAQQPAGDTFLLNCTGKGGCEVVGQKPLGANGAILSVDNPPAGEWRVVVQARDQVQRQFSYRIQEASLTANDLASEQGNSIHVHGATWSLAVPEPRDSALYAAFHIAGTPGKEEQKNGLRIAMTPLTAGAP